MATPDIRIHEINKRLQQRPEMEPDSLNVWWDNFATEFFEDDSTLTLIIMLEDGLKKYTIGRALIPRYFRSIFEGGVVDHYLILRNARESFHNTSITLDCDRAEIVSTHVKPLLTKVVTEGRVILEFTFDDLMRIRVWHMEIRNHREMIPRHHATNMQQDPSVQHQMTKNITRQGLTNHTLNFLRLCVILEPMQELMSRQKVYGLLPRDCLKTTLFQKWQRMLSPPETNRQTGKRRKRKIIGTNSDASNRGRRKTSSAPLIYNNLSQNEDVLIVGEPTLMSGNFQEEDERLITRFENSQFNSEHLQGTFFPSNSSTSSLQPCMNKHSQSPITSAEELPLIKTLSIRSIDNGKPIICCDNPSRSPSHTLTTDRKLETTENSSSPSSNANTSTLILQSDEVKEYSQSALQSPLYPKSVSIV